MLDHHLLGGEGHGAVPGDWNLVVRGARACFDEGDLLVNLFGAGRKAHGLDVIERLAALDQVMGAEHDVGAGGISPALYLTIRFHVGEEQDGDYKEGTFEVAVEGVAYAQGPVQGLLQGILCQDRSPLGCAGR